MTSPPPGSDHGPEPPSWRRGSVGSSHVWDETRRAAHRSGTTWPGDAATTPEASLSAERLAEIVSGAVASTVRDLFPDLDEDTRERIDATLRGRIADLLEGIEEPEPEAGPPEPPPEPPQPIPLAPEAVDPILADRIRADFDRLGAGMHAMKVLRETAITVILETLRVERSKAGTSAYAKLSPQELTKIDNLERRIAKLTSSIAKTRAALARVASMKDFEPGIPSIYRQVQGLTSLDEKFGVKRELLSEIFDANMQLQKDLRQLRPQRDARDDSGLDRDGPRHSQVA
jgi:hypothetical protein